MEVKANGRGAIQRKIRDQNYQSLVLPDPVAFAYLEEDPTTDVVARNETFKGYESYCVEQWACSRTDPTFIITTYTGDPSHYIVASVLSVPVDESSWSQRLKLYFDALTRYHAKRKETGMGIIMITNLDTFPSSLTVVLVPYGSIREHREEFYVNEDLKRMGCSGRMGLTLSKPSPATAAKFYQLYRVSQKVPLNAAVLELVKLCQTSLLIFGLLEEEYIDGLLCDVTERAINDWWIEFGTEYYSVEPHDGILGPTTVAALLGTLIGARNRLHASGAPVAKDVFEVETTKRAIAYFQKTHKMAKTRRLDRQTLNRLHRSTSKLASGEGWFVPRTVKSTLSEFTGKGGEMVTHMIGSKDKAIADVETIDIERFAQNVHGSRSKWLWQGKTRKQASNEESSSTAMHAALENSQQRQSIPQPSSAEKQPDQSEERERNLFRKLPEKQQNTKSNDSNRALGRIKGAVGLRNNQHHHHQHQQRHKKRNDSLEKLDSNLEPALTDPTPLSLNQENNLVYQDDRMFSQFSGNERYPEAKFTDQIAETPTVLERVEYQENVEPPSDGEEYLDLDPELNGRTFTRSPSPSPLPSIAGSVYRGVYLDELFDGNSVLANNSFAPEFRRTQSFVPVDGDFEGPMRRARWPRNLSFSVAEEGLSTWAKVLDAFQPRDQEDDIYGANYDYERSLRIRNALQSLDSDLLSWVQKEIDKADRLAAELTHNADELHAACDVREEEGRELALESKEIVTGEREQLEEVVKEIELLSSKLDYETKMLKGKVEDVETGVGEFERQVLMVEDRVAQLERSMEPRESWGHWLLRVLIGAGSPEAV